jgi:TatD DNase family protein
MNLIDTHCHIYAAEFNGDRDAMLARAEDEGITKMLMPAIDRSTHEQMIRLEMEFPDRCKAMMALHPGSVKEDYQSELRLAEEWFTRRPFIGVGETGLDFYWDLTYTKQQYEVFQQQIEWALRYDLPVVIHSRNSIDECIGMIAKNQNGSLRGVFHCFSGSIEQARKIVDLGFYIGIGGVVTFKKSGLDTVVEQADLENIVLETDAPYLAPTPFRGKRNEVSYIKYMADKVADIKKIPVEDVARITTDNAQKLFRL